MYNTIVPSIIAIYKFLFITEALGIYIYIYIYIYGRGLLRVNLKVLL